MSKKKVIIIGGGPAGLTAGYQLLKNSKDYDVTIKMTKDANGWDISDDGNDDFKNVISGGLLSSDLLS